MKQYYQDHKEKIKEQSRQYRVNNPEWRKQYRIDNKEKIKTQCEKYHKQWCLDNLEKVKNYRKKYYKQYYQDNKQRYFNNINHRQYMNIKRKTDIKFNLNHNISGAIYKSLKGNKTGRHWETLVDYTLKDLIKRLRKTIPVGYTWQDLLSSELHIDHIIPISAFNFTKSEHIDFKNCWALENLQLLPAKENMTKHNKLYKPFQPALQF